MVIAIEAERLVVSKARGNGGQFGEIVSVLQDEKNLRVEGWHWLHNNINVLKATEVYI